MTFEAFWNWFVSDKVFSLIFLAGIAVFFYFLIKVFCFIAEIISEFFF